MLDDDGFVTVGKNGRPRTTQGAATTAAKGTIDESPLTPVKDPIYHPDFAVPLSPSHVLIKTKDDTLFWFSLSLLAQYSAVFAEIDHDSLRHFGSTKPPSRCLHLPTTSSHGLAFVFHIILLEWQQALHNESHESPISLLCPRRPSEATL